MAFQFLFWTIESDKRGWGSTHISVRCRPLCQIIHSTTSTLHYHQPSPFKREHFHHLWNEVVYSDRTAVPCRLQPNLARSYRLLISMSDHLSLHGVSGRPIDSMPVIAESIDRRTQFAHLPGTFTSQRVTAGFQLSAGCDRDPSRRVNEIAAADKRQHRSFSKLSQKSDDFDSRAILGSWVYTKPYLQTTNVSK